MRITESNQKRPEGQEKMLTTQEFADRLGLSHGAIKKWVARRQLTIVKLGRAVRIPESELERIIRANTRPADEAR
jgi:excisionase family DNA binding protein